MSYAAAASRGVRGGRGQPQARPLLPPVLNHVPALSKNTVFVDLRAVKQNFDKKDRDDFLLKDLGVGPTEVYDIYNEPESFLLRVAFFTSEQFERYLARLADGVPWSAEGGQLVYGWAPGDSITHVRLTGVPADLPISAVRTWAAQFGRVTRIFRTKDRTFTRAANGITHFSIAVTPGVTLPAFVTLVTPDGTPDKRAFVHTDDFRRRCSRCGAEGHVAQFCRAGRRASGAEPALWSVLNIPEALLPPPLPEEEMDDLPPPQQPVPPLREVMDTAAASLVPPLLEMGDAAAASSIPPRGERKRRASSTSSADSDDEPLVAIVDPAASTPAVTPEAAAAADGSSSGAAFLPSLTSSLSSLPSTHPSPSPISPSPISPSPSLGLQLPPSSGESLLPPGQRPPPTEESGGPSPLSGSSNHQVCSSSRLDTHSRSRSRSAHHHISRSPSVEDEGQFQNACRKRPGKTTAKGQNKNMKKLVPPSQQISSFSSNSSDGETQ